MTEPSQYFKGRTVQEQMNEVISYVDARAEEVAAAKADDVLEPAEQAKNDAIAAKEAAEDARDTTLGALPQIQQDITDLKAEDVALDGRLDNVELRITTAEGNIVTIQGRVTAVETKNSQQDSAIAALQTADTNNVKITGTHAIGNYAVTLVNNQEIFGSKYMMAGLKGKDNRYDVTTPETGVIHFGSGLSMSDKNNVPVCGLYPQLWTDGTVHVFLTIHNRDGTTKFIPLGVGD